MNLFFLDPDPKKCAIYHCDKHVVKMLLEIVQMLYTAHHVLGPIENLPENCYKKVHVKHPTAIWIRQNKYNYSYATTLGMLLAQEYTFRYNKIHKCEEHIIWLNSNLPNFKDEKPEYSESTVLSSNKFLQLAGLSETPLAMPEECKMKDTIQSYRKYYLYYKKRFARWTNRPVPIWFSYVKRFF
jgi:hypothetical protein